MSSSIQDQKNQRPEVRSLLKDLGEDARLRLYAVVAGVLAIIAITVVLLQGGGQHSGISGCTSIVLSTYRDSCITKLAYSSENAAMCSYLSSTGASDTCMYNIAVNTSNASICSGIYDPSTRYSCVYDIANTSGSYQLCYRLNSSSENECLTSLATRLSTPSICGNITNYTALTICESSAELSSVRATSNALTCGLVSNSTNPATVNGIALYSGVYGYSTGPVSQGNYSIGSSYESPLNIVQFLPNATYSARDLCYLYVSYRLADPAYCSEIPNSTVQGLCIDVQSSPTSLTTNSLNGSLGSITVNGLSVNITSLNYSQLSSIICANASLAGPGCNSIFKIYEAIQTRNATICATLQNYTVYSCYSALAQAYANESYCGYIKNATLNSACIEDIYYNSS